MYTKCSVIRKQALCQGYGRISLLAAEIAAPALPGQFVMLRFWQGNHPFFMRPFSLNSVDKNAGTLTILYKIVGEGTKILAQLNAGAEVEILGPLGTYFPLPQNGRRIAVIGRGVGAAPMRYLAEYARAQGLAVSAYVSANSPHHLFDQEYYQDCGCEYIDSSDPSVNVTAFFEKDLQNAPFDAAYVCGSKRLMRDVSRMMDQYGFAGYVSLEEHMACGIGACKGCVCTVYDENGEESYARVCKDGPVFPIQRLVKKNV